MAIAFQSFGIVLLLFVLLLSPAVDGRCSGSVDQICAIIKSSLYCSSDVRCLSPIMRGDFSGCIGTIPTEIACLPSLTVQFAFLFHIHPNHSTDTMLSQHRHLYNNSITGTIPTEVGLLTSLKILFVFCVLLFHCVLIQHESQY